MSKLLSAVLVVILSHSAMAQRTYWKGSVTRLATHNFPHTHVMLDSVVVVYTAAEADSDYHIRLRDPKDTIPEHFVVAECIPLLPCHHPKVGEMVTVWGITRYDAEHGWAEIHPVERGPVTIGTMTVAPHP